MYDKYDRKLYQQSIQLLVIFMGSSKSNKKGRQNTSFEMWMGAIVRLKRSSHAWYKFIFTSQSIYAENRKCMYSTIACLTFLSQLFSISNSFTISHSRFLTKIMPLHCKTNMECHTIAGVASLSTHHFGPRKRRLKKMKQIREGTEHGLEAWGDSWVVSSPS